MSRITERPPQDTNLIGSQNKQGTAFRYAEAETGRPVNYDRKTGEVRYFPKDMENFMRFTQSPKMTFNPVATHKAMENQQNESYANRRLDIILETVSEILENQRLGKKKRKDSPEGEPAGVKVHYKNVENASERLSAAHRELHDAKKEGDAKSKHFREVEQARAALRRSHRRLQSAKGK